MYHQGELQEVRSLPCRVQHNDGAVFLELEERVSWTAEVGMQIVATKEVLNPILAFYNC